MQEHALKEFPVKECFLVFANTLNPEPEKKPNTRQSVNRNIP